ncbi:MAG: hypothetical protein K6E50_08445 [Lachnospiraceae bacterium]|nr:hypothetical protein [Lachnospiraceae bacterium]
METDIAKQLNDIRQYAEHTLKMQNGLMVLMAVAILYCVIYNMEIGNASLGKGVGPFALLF